MNIFGLGPLELVVILVIVLLVFGVGRIARVGGELGKGVSAFREGLKDGQTNNNLPEGEEANNGKA